MSTAAGRQALLGWILAFSVVSTAAHFTHNFVEVDQYPDELVSGEVIRAAILVSWPLLTAVGLLGYALYARGRYLPAHVCLAVYSLLGISTLGHFLDGPPDIAPLWFATIFTDALAGAAILAFVLLSARETASAASGDSAPT